MGVGFFDEGDSVVVRIRGMRECIAYIREEALAYQLDSVAEFLKAACRELDDGLDAIDDSPTSLHRVDVRKYQ